MSKPQNLSAFGSDNAALDQGIEGVLAGGTRAPITPPPVAPTPTSPVLDVRARNDEPIAKVSILSEVGALAASLGIPTGADPSRPYAPDNFLKAIRIVHDQLLDVKTLLQRQASSLKERELAVVAREEAVRFQEERMRAFDGLVDLTQPGRPTAAQALEIAAAPAKRGWFR